MTIKELSMDQFRELKEHILCTRTSNVSYDDLLNVDKLVSDTDVEKEYGGIDFTPDDFFCSCAGQGVSA